VILALIHWKTARPGTTLNLILKAWTDPITEDGIGTGTKWNDMLYDIQNLTNLVTTAIGAKIVGLIICYRTSY
jgi:hypothetical protein